MILTGSYATLPNRPSCDNYKPLILVPKNINDNKYDNFNEDIKKDPFSTLQQKYPSNVFTLLHELICLIMNVYERKKVPLLTLGEDSKKQRNSELNNESMDVFTNVVNELKDEENVCDVEELRDDTVVVKNKVVECIKSREEPIDSTKPISLQILGNNFSFNLNIVGNNITINTPNLNTTIPSPLPNLCWKCHTLDTTTNTHPTTTTTTSPLSSSKELSHKFHTMNISTTPLPNTQYKQLLKNGCTSVIEDCIPLSVPELLQELERFNHDVVNQNHHYNYYDNMDEPSLDTLDEFAVGDNKEKEGQSWWTCLVNWECCCESYNIWRENDETQGKKLDTIEKMREQEREKERRETWNENRGKDNGTVSTKWSECGMLEVEDFHLEA